jgi:hypothetical protein
MDKPESPRRNIPLEALHQRVAGISELRVSSAGDVRHHHHVPREVWPR